ncbi:MAG: hypothetical protein HY080_16475 [Gammaproteobacteria bacterium]|nr:hypothetical protein [Gammaproteobacteria bacterium]
MQDIKNPPGTLTFQVAAVLFWASAAFEVISITSKVPLFGVLLAAPSVIVYHGLYAVLFILFGLGIWWRRPWGYTLLHLTCAVYIVDRLQAAMFPAALQEYILESLRQVSEQIKMLPIDTSVFQQPDMIAYLVWVMQVMALTMAGCWLGFWLWGIYRRSYFNNHSRSTRRA